MARPWHTAIGSNSSGDFRIRFAWKRLVRLGPPRWSEIAFLRAVRVAFGVIVPLVLGEALGHREYGAFAALGALAAGFASFQGESRSRVAAAGIASIGMALSTFVGATAALTPWLLIPIVAVWGYFTGLAICLGPWPSVAILQWSVALLIAVGLPFGPAEASVRVCFVLAGGLFQALLVAASWMIRSGSRERTALASSFRSLATYASRLKAGTTDPPSPVAFPAGSALDDPNPLLLPATRWRYVELLEVAERIRASLAALATESTHVTASYQDDLHALLGDAATALTLMGEALTAPRTGRLFLLRKLRRTLAGRSISHSVEWRWAGEVLLKELRAAGRIVANLDAVRPKAFTVPAASERALARADNKLSWILTTLRANLTTTSEAGRHALRLAVAAGLAEAIAQTTGLYQGRWAALTVFIVLKPDYASTVYRGVQRAIGTAIGAILGGTMEFVHPGYDGQLLAAALCITAAYALFDVSYLLFSVFLTAFIVVLLQILGNSAVMTAEARFLETFIGATLGLAAYLVWPTWEGATAQEKFARLLDAHSAYMAGLLLALAHPDTLEASRLRTLQAVARRARSDGEAATTRLADEPTHSPLTPQTAQAITMAVARLAQAELALHALVLLPQEIERYSESKAIFAEPIDELGLALDSAMKHLALALRRLAPPEPIPRLRSLHAQLRRTVANDESVVVGLTDRLVDAVDTVNAILNERFKIAPSATPHPA